MSILTIGPETWPWGPVGWWRSLHDRVSRGPACKPSPRAKLESDRYWWSLFLDNGTPERPWPTTTSMRSKAYWFRAQNSAYRSVATSLPSNSFLVGACRKCGARPLPTVDVAGGRNPLICPTSSEPSASPYAVLGRGLSVEHQPSRW